MHGQSCYQQLPHPFMNTIASDVRTVIHLLGYGGLIPFLATSMALWVTEEARAVLTLALCGYGAVILAFLGAIHWGRIIASAGAIASPVPLLLFSVLPSLIGWISLILDPLLGLALLAISFVLLYLVDRRLFADLNELRWYLRMRGQLTLVVLLCLSGAWTALILAA